MPSTGLDAGPGGTDLRGMSMERTVEGLEARYRPRGFGRFFSAGFLLVWLCGWAAGECFAIWMLVRGVAAFLESGGSGPDAPPPAVMAFAGLFLLLWLSFWTLGGYAAGREFLRLIWSEDRILARHDALVLHRRIGPFRSTRIVPRADVVGIHAIGRRNRVMAETTGGAVELTTLVPIAERESLVSTLRAALGVRADGEREGLSLPARWREVIDGEGRTALVRDEDQRRARGRFAWGLTLLVAAVTCPVLLDARTNSEARPAVLLLGVLTLALGCGAWRISRTRLEWRIDPGRLSLRRRSAGGARDLFDGGSLEFLSTSDSDGDRWYTLYAVAPGAPPTQVPPRLSDLRLRKKIAREMDDPNEPRRLGAWIARRSGLHLDDRTPTEPKPIDLAELAARLEATGRIGRWLAKRIPRIDADGRRSG